MNPGNEKYHKHVQTLYNASNLLLFFVCLVNKTNYFCFILQLTPRGGSRGKGTNDPIKFLPVPPAKRAKPTWQQNAPTFMLSGKPEDYQNGSGGIDLITELTASKYDDK